MSYSNYRWQIRKQCWTGLFAFKASPGLVTSFPDCFPDCVAELKRDHFYGRLSKQLKMRVAYLKAGPQVRMYSDYLRATREAEKEDSIELP